MNRILDVHAFCPDVALLGRANDQFELEYGS